VTVIARLARRLGVGTSLVLSREECQAIARRVAGFAKGPGTTGVGINNSWRGDLRWGRQRVTLAGDRREVALTITRSHAGASGTVEVSELGDAALEAAVRSAERLMYGGRTLPPDVESPTPAFVYATPRIWSETSAGLTAPTRGELARDLLASTGGDLVAAGYLAVSARAQGSFGPNSGLYCASTDAECSITVRDPRGRGSGWAGASSYDWGTIDPLALTRRAREKCVRSRDPVAVEPGRYTVVLEPQAVGDLVGRIIYPGGMNLNRFFAEMGQGPFADPARQGFSKLGLKVVDQRITIGHDPEDLQLGVCPFQGGGEPYRRVNWIERGVLQCLAYDRHYALSKLNEDLGYPDSGAFRMSGGDATVEEMISTTKRGLLVTRLSDFRTLDNRSLLQTGITRDGLWLIENGRITKPVKNLRFAESPLVALNSIEQLGRPIPVFRPGAPIVVPPLKVRGFTFTRLVDAV
jgi:predicted Zn-dependent protease